MNLEYYNQNGNGAIDAKLDTLPKTKPQMISNFSYIRNINIDYNIHFMAHALLDNEAATDIGNDQELVILLFKKLFSEINNTSLHIYIQNYIYTFNNINLINNLTDPITICGMGISNHAVTLMFDHINKRIIICNTGYNMNRHIKYDTNNHYCFKIYNTNCYYNLIIIYKYIISDKSKKSNDNYIFIIINFK